jgi:YHS domain-containing protein
VTEGITAQFAGFTVGFCCENCQASFNEASDEKKTATVAKMVAVVNTECPGSGQAVDAEQVALYNGFAVGFCCEDCEAQFNDASDSKKAAVIAKSVKAVNTECPGSGMAVSGETFAAYHGVLVGFCCEDCEAEFMNADDGKRHKMTAKMVATSAGGCTDECKAMAAKAEAKS